MKVLLYALALVLILSVLLVTGCRTTKEAEVAVPAVKVDVPTVEMAMDVPDIHQPNVDVAAVEIHAPDAAPAGPQGPVGPRGRVGPDAADVGPGAGHVVIFGIDWVYLVSSALVLVALAAGLAIGRGTRSQLLGH